MQFTDLITPRDPSFTQQLRSVWRDRPDLQQAYPDPEAAGLLRWAAVNAALEYPDTLGRFYPPIPPQDLRRDIGGGDSAHAHLWNSVDNLEAVATLWEMFTERPITTVESVLDFGCGPGRVSRWWPLGLTGVRCHGYDVRRAPIDWCAANLEGHYARNAVSPPLDLPDDSIDLVYALSVFSHLEPRAAAVWIEELARVCRPDGLILLTAFGAFSLYVIERDPERSRAMGIGPAMARRYLRRLDTEQVVFHQVTGERRDALGEVDAVYGQTFFTPEYVRSAFGDFVVTLGHVPATYSMLQDFFVLQPK